MDDLKALRIAAQNLDDAIKTRVSISNRISIVAKIEPEFVTDRELWFGPAVDQFVAVERMLAKIMQKTFQRALPDLHDWTVSCVGLGVPSMARLIGSIGDPLWARPHHFEPNRDFDPDQPASAQNSKRLTVADAPFRRGLYQLWSYCGVGDASRVRHANMTGEEMLAMVRTPAKALLHTMVEGAVRCKSRGTSLYGNHYDRERLKYAGTDLTLGHQQAIAYRHTAKEILRDMLLVRKGLEPQYGLRPL